MKHITILIFFALIVFLAVRLSSTRDELVQAKKDEIACIKEQVILTNQLTDLTEKRIQDLRALEKAAGEATDCIRCLSTVPYSQLYPMLCP